MSWWNQFQPQMSPANRNTSGIRTLFSPQPAQQAQQPVETKELATFNLSESLNTKEIDPQTTSPFYSGRIPAEIRTLIFQYALTESPSPAATRVPHNSDIHNHHNPVPLPHLPISQPFRETRHWNPRAESAFYEEPFRKIESGFDWLRPDNTRPVINHYGLLQTCRRIYLETHHLPLQQKEFVFYGYRGRETSSRLSDPITYFSSRHASSPSSVPGRRVNDIAPRSVRLFTQLFWLEDTANWVQERYSYSLGRNVSVRWYEPLVNLRITIRRGDWWDWERDEGLKISPYRRSVNGTADMERDMVMVRKWVEGEGRKRGGGDGGGGGGGDGDEDQMALFQRNAWGLAFKKMVNLETLTIEFETSEDKKLEMDRIVEWATKWRFPLVSKEEQQRKREELEAKDGAVGSENSREHMGYHFTQESSEEEEGDDGSDDDDSEEDNGELSPGSRSGLHDRPVRTTTSSRNPEVEAPMPETKRYLSADNCSVQKMSWRAGRGSWSMRCTACPKDRPSADASCDVCQERQKLEDNGLGPRLLVWTVTWKAVSADNDAGR